MGVVEGFGVDGREADPPAGFGEVRRWDGCLFLHARCGVVGSGRRGNLIAEGAETCHGNFDDVTRLEKRRWLLAESDSEGLVTLSVLEQLKLESMDLQCQ